MKKVFYFMPDNPMKNDSGNKTRALTFLNYFKTRGFQVDFFSETKWGEWTQEQAEEFRKSGLADNLYLVDRRPPKKQFLKYLFVKGSQVIYNLLAGMDTRGLPNYGTNYLCKAVHKIVKDKKYDYVVINYATWANIIRKKEYFPGARFAVNTHDFLTSQYQRKGNGKYIGKTFKEEIKRLNLFDELWVESTDEHYLFSQFCSNKVIWVPFMLKDHTSLPDGTYKYDLIYVASDNPYNRLSAKWFMEEVYPLLSKNIRICIIGKITRHIEDKENIEKVLFAPTLEEYYKCSKVVICPMLKGTGIKVKVTEAYSFGLPVVCNERGVDGLPNKMDNGCMVTDDPKQFADDIHLLLNDEGVYEEYKRQSKRMFFSSFEQERCYQKLDEILEV